MVDPLNQHLHLSPPWLCDSGEVPLTLLPAPEINPVWWEPMRWPQPPSQDLTKAAGSNGFWWIKYEESGLVRLLKKVSGTWRSKFFQEKKKRFFFCPQVKPIKKEETCILNDTIYHHLYYNLELPLFGNILLCKDTPLLFKPSKLVLSLTIKTSLVVIFSNTESNLLCADLRWCPFSQDDPTDQASFHPWPHTESSGELLKLHTVYATNQNWNLKAGSGLRSF